MSTKYTENFNRNKAFLAGHDLSVIVNIRRTFSPYTDFGKCKIIGIGSTSILFQTLPDNTDRYAMLCNIEIINTIS